jgi:hypothetical protein
MSKILTTSLAVVLLSVAVSPAFAQKAEEARKEGESCGGPSHLTCRVGLDCIRNEKHPESIGVCRKPAAHPE